MSKMVQTGEFFVVGGSVQGDRASYIERAADQELYDALQAGEFCCVLEPRASGKSSLMGRTVQRLREDGQLAAVVDLTQIGAREREATAERWYYSIAYRIGRELRLKVDLQGWWQENSVLDGEQRLAEFFRDIVLSNTTAPITIFVDEVERAVGTPFAQALFASIKACYLARVAEPDYARLNFVMLGTASPRELCPDPSISPFEQGHRVVLEDFSLEELQQLAPGFGVDPPTARSLLADIFKWTRGQPYLTQKLARQVARAGATRSEDGVVDRLVAERFLAPAANRDEALFNHIRAAVTQPSPHMRAALTTLGRVRKGMLTASDLESPAQNLLRLSGLVIDTKDGQLALRNPIYEQVFTSRWVSSVLPFQWRGFALAGVAASLLVLIPLWYFQVLPRPYIRTLSDSAVDVPTAVTAYDSLRRLPGFGDTAQRLLTDLMTQRSQAAVDFNAVMEADRGLRRVPGFGARADELLSQYWYRRTRSAARNEDRDAALIYGLRGLATFPDSAGRALVNELIDQDYGWLQRTYRISGAVGSWVMDWQRRQLTVVDQAHQVMRFAADNPEPRAVGRLTALQYIPVARDLAVDETGSVGRFELVLDLDHPAPEQLRLTLQSPDGAIARLSLADRTVQRSGRLRLRSRGTPLSALADAGRQGVWRLGLVDETEGAAGRLVRWSLSFSAQGEIWTDTPESGLAVPDPIRTDQIQVRLSPDGMLAAAIPARADGVGALTLWDLAQGTAVADLRLSAVPTAVGFAADGTRLYTVADNVLTLWDAARGLPVARVATENGFTLPPAVSPEGGYLMVAEALEDGAAPLFSLLRARDGRLLASSEGSAQARAWTLGPDARYLAVTESDRLVRVFNPRKAGALASLAHSDRIRRVVVLGQDAGLITTDDLGVIRHWRLPAGPDDAATSTYRGITRDSGSLAARGKHMAYLAHDYSVALRALDADADPGFAVRPGVAPPLELDLSSDGRSLASRSGSVLRLWRLPEPEPVEPILAGLASLSLDAGGETAALGDLGGHLRAVTRAGAQPGSGKGWTDLNYLGHNGPITAVAMDASRGTAVSGGSDGVVRLWDLSSGAPTAPFLRHPQGPINAVALSGDGAWVASAAEYGARVWPVGDDQLQAEIPVNGAALALAFTPDSSRLVTSDSAGNILVTNLRVPGSLRTWLAAEPVAALAAAPGGGLLAGGGVAGAVELWNLDDGSAAAAALRFPSPVRSLSFSADGAHLLVQTVSWYHRVSLAGELPEQAESRIAPLGAAVGLAALGPGARTLRAVAIGRRLQFSDLDMGRPNALPLTGDLPELGERWQQAVGLAVDSTGQVRPLWAGSTTEPPPDPESVN